MKTLPCLFALCVVSFVCMSNEPCESSKIEDRQGIRQIPVINKEKTYPKKAIKLEDVADISYIPLETSPEILVDRNAQLVYVSDKRIVVYNRRLGDVFIFGMDGKVVSSFNRRGPDAYNYIRSIAYDEKNKEVFILASNPRNIYVFTENGIFKRVLRASDTVKPTEIYNFDDQNLLIFDDKQNANTGPITRIDPANPFYMLSKKEGTIVSKLNITMDKIIAKTITESTGPNTSTAFTMMSDVGNNCKFGRNFILSDFSLDTIYHLKQDRTLTPIFVQQPTVFSDRPKVVTVGMYTDRFAAINILSWNIMEEKRLKRSSPDLNGKYLLYDFQEDQFFELDKDYFGVYKVDIPQNMAVDWLLAEGLKNRLKAGRLEGELKKIATKIDEEDNPVVKLIKFK